MNKIKNFDYDSIMTIQKAFNDRLFADLNVDLDYLEPMQEHRILKDFCIHIIDEIMEVLHELNWKMHKKYDDVPVDRKRLIEEFVDILKFWFNMLMIMDVSEEEIVDAFNKKTKLVLKRYENESLRKKKLE